MWLFQERIREDIAEAEIKVYPSSLLPEDEDVLQANAPIRKHLPLAVVGGYFLHRPFHIDLQIYKVVRRYSMDSYFTRNVACVFLMFALWRELSRSKLHHNFMFLCLEISSLDHDRRFNAISTQSVNICRLSLVAVTHHLLSLNYNCFITDFIFFFGR